MCKPTENFEKLVALFNIQDKGELRQWCRDLTVDSRDLAYLVFAGRIGGLSDYRYACHFHEQIPSDVPTPVEFEAFGRSKVGTLAGDARTFARKLDQLMLVRRLFSAHLFYSPSHRYWQLFYFDQRDQAQRRNHWKHGPHIHYSSDLLARLPSFAVWEKITVGNTRGMNSNMYLRYI